IRLSVHVGSGDEQNGCQQAGKKGWGDRLRAHMIRSLRRRRHPWIYYCETILIRLPKVGRKMTNRFIPLIALVAFFVAADQEAALSADKPAVAILSNGDFQTDADGDGVPDGWASPKGGVSYPTEGTNRFMRLASPKPDEMVITYRQVRIPKG